MSADRNQRIAALASHRAVHRAFGWLHLHEPALRRWQLEFLRIPAPPFAEGERAHWFCERFRELGLARPHLDAEGNALAELPRTGGAADGPVVLLSAHLDTVFPPGTDCTPSEDGPRILCPGASDNGAGLTALLALAAALRHAEISPPCTLLFAANVGEEGEGDLRGMRYLCERSPFAARLTACLALEGSGTATVVDRALGSRRLRVTVNGPGGHSWADAGLPSPILALSAMLLALDRLALPSNPRTTLNCGTIAGGTSINSIPGAATAGLDLRSTSATELDRTELAVLRTLESTLVAFNESSAARSRNAPTLEMQVERIGNRAAGSLPSTSPLLASLRAVDRHLHLTTEPRIGSTDANLPLSLGLPALALGAGGVGTGIHTLAEAFDPTGRDLALRRLLLLVLETCALAAEGSLPAQLT